MQNNFFFFIFKHRHRKRAFNNFLKIKKIKNNYIFDLSGAIKYYLVGLPLYIFVKIFSKYFKNFIFISCDGLPQIQSNGVNIWFGGTSYKVPEKLKKSDNNCFVFENFSKKEPNLINFYPYKPVKAKSIKEHKIIFIGSFNIVENKLIDQIWDKENELIFNDLKIIDNFSFWEKYDLQNHKKLQTFYLQLKERLRFNLIIKLKDIFNEKFILVGTKWKNFIETAQNDEFDISKIRNLYNGNICLDFGSKWGSNIFYPRSVEIIENGGLLFQSEQINSPKELYSLEIINNFNNFEKLVSELNNLINNSNLMEQKFDKQFSYFSNENLNYMTLNRIYEISKKNN